MKINGVMAQCQRCGIRSSEVLILRGTLFVIAMCGTCSLEMAVINSNGQEVRVIAIASERFEEVSLCS